MNIYMTDEGTLLTEEQLKLVEAILVYTATEEKIESKQ